MSTHPSSEGGADLAALLGPGYAAPPASFDEMWTPDEGVREDWQPFVSAAAGLGAERLERHRRDADRLLRENGVTYVVHGGADGSAGRWRLDPVPLILGEEDWKEIAAGLRQRAELLNLILKDFYGPRTLLREGLVPADLVFAHPGFLRACDRVGIDHPRPLATYAGDLARGPDGRMWVLGDRTQAPSGAGYALENRTTIVRAMPGPFHATGVRRLVSFFRTLRAGLAGLATPPREDPRIVILTPGPLNETYFEHAYLAAYLGYPLVQGDDLTVWDGRVWLKSIDGLRPVDVILRRVDDTFCDPLELRPDSHLGVPGLVEAARRGTVAVANPLGSGVLEHPGILPFLPAIARQRLGEELLLPSVATWWCGQPRELGFVLEKLDRLVIKAVDRSVHPSPVFGDRLSRAEIETWRGRIRAAPHLYVGQERVELSTAPSWIGGRFEPRHVVLRGFVAAYEDGYAVMPGGLTRSAPDSGNLIVSNQQGGVSKDTWVRGLERGPHVSLWQTPEAGGAASSRSIGLPSRVAENLFWVGRYAERVEGAARMLRTALDENVGNRTPRDQVDAEFRAELLRALTEITETHPGFVGEGAEERLRRPDRELHAVALDGARAGSLVSVLDRLLGSAYAVRDRWSSDTWRVMNGLESLHGELRKSPRIGLSRIQTDLDRLVTALAALTGLCLESMTRDPGWILLDMGRRIERSILLVTLVRSTLLRPHPEAVEHALAEAVLRTSECLITYRRLHRSALELPRVLDLLLLDESNPRSLLYQLSELERRIEKLPPRAPGGALGDEARLVLEASTQLRLGDRTILGQSRVEVVREHVDELLGRIGPLISRISEVVTRDLFTHAQGSRSLGELRSSR